MPGPIDARANETFSVVPHCKQAHKAAEAFQPSGPMFKGAVLCAAILSGIVQLRRCACLPVAVPARALPAHLDIWSVLAHLVRRADLLRELVGPARALAAGQPSVLF